VYQHYERRDRPDRGARLLRLLVAFAAVAAVFVAAFVFLTAGNVEQPVSEADGVKQVSTVKDAKLAVYEGKTWGTRFWNGVNLGDTLPGHAPGELAPTREDYMRWFPQMKTMNVDVLRVYTILDPGETSTQKVDPLAYAWEGWDVPTYHERKKKSYGAMREAFDSYNQVATPPQ
jgi:hypothetical protein